VTNTEKIRDVFAILHDGVIESWTGDKKELTLKIGCQYLAERVDPSFEFFFVVLFDVDRFALVPWMSPIDLEQEYFTELKDIFQAELDILSADIENDLVKVSCNQRDSTLNYCGGFLYMSCIDVKVFEQKKAELSIEFLDSICREYWDDFSK
jgi:hypothetical protein